MTHQQKIDNMVLLNRLWEDYGIELLDMLGVRLLTSASNEGHAGNSLSELAYKTAGLQIQSLHSKLKSDLLLDEWCASITSFQ